jgi:pputative hage head morphogenesis protein, SPP1 gp7 family
MKSFNDLIAELEVARSLLHERIKNGLNRKVAKFYDEMIADLQAQILRKKNITRNLAKTIENLKAALSIPDFGDEFRAIAQDELKHLRKYNKLAGFVLFSHVLPQSAIQSLINTTLLEGATVNAWNKGLNIDQKTRLEREIKIGVSLGETNELLAARVARALGKSKRDAASIAVTAAGAIVSAVRQKFFEANVDVIKAYKYQATLDTRTSALCRAYDGLMWDTNYEPIGHSYPFRQPRINTHFNCRSTIIPVIKGADELKNVPPATRSSMNGYVPQDINFNDWLKTQPKDVIEKTLGAGRAELFLQGKITMRDLITQQGRELNLTQLKKYRNLNEYSNVRAFSRRVTKEFKESLGLKTDRIFGSEAYLYSRHKDMFKGRADISQTIDEILKGYDFKKEATKKGGVIIGKAISDKKMIDVGINLADGVVFHVNKKKWDKTMKESRSKR